MRRDTGAALILVLWLIALLTALIGAFALTARVEAMQGKVLSGGVQAQELARAGMEYSLVRLADSEPRTRWLPDGRLYPWRFAGGDLELRIVDETGKVDLNQAGQPLLSALMQVLGTERARAEQVSAAILDWRDADSLTQVNGGAEDPDYAAAGLAYGAKDAPFETVAEVEQVLGMDPVLYARLEPYLTLYSGRGEPDPTYAQAPVLAAMGLDPALYLAQRAQPSATAATAQLVGGGSGTYSIESRARLNDGRIAVLRTVIRTGAGPIPGSVYTALRWQQGTALQ
ncbi:MAG: type II secretion system minor pseudopilin GspK [Pseudoxanthomonas sp.]